MNFCKTCNMFYALKCTKHYERSNNFPCYKCGKLFYDEHSFSIHNNACRMHDENLMKRIKNVTHRCTDCGQLFLEKSCLLSHVCISRYSIPGGQPSKRKSI